MRVHFQMQALLLNQLLFLSGLGDILFLFLDLIFWFYWFSNQMNLSRQHVSVVNNGGTFVLL